MRHRFTRFAGCALLGLACAGAHAQKNDTVTITLQTNNTAKPANQILLVEQDMGFTTVVKEGGITARSTAPPDGKTGQFLYFSTDPTFVGAPGKVSDLYVTVKFLDKGTDSFQLEYDATNPDQNGGDPTSDDPATDIHRIAGAPRDVVVKSDTGKYISHVFHLNSVWFGKRQEGGADFRIDDLGDGPEVISSVSVSKTNPVKLNIPFVGAPPVLDGKLDEKYWTTTDNLVTLCDGALDVIRPTVWKGVADYCATFRFAWDNQALYVAADVKDDVPRNNNQDCGLEWAGDGFEVFWGFDQSSPGRTKQIDGQDFHWYISATPAGMEPTWAYESVGGTVQKPNDDCSTGGNAKIFDRADGKPGYVMEVRIPWSEWKGTDGKAHAAPVAGQLNGFTMFGNDGDKETAAPGFDQEIAMSWANIPGPSGNPSAWLTIQLGGAAAAKGDLNGDGKIDIKDATISLSIAVGLRIADAGQAQSGDMNGDGKLDLKDTTLLLKAAVGG